MAVPAAEMVERTQSSAVPAPAVPAAEPIKHTSFQERIYDGYQNNPWLDKSSNLALLHSVNDLWYHGDALYVPNIKELRLLVLNELHDSPYSGLGGVARTVHRVK